MTDPNAYHLNDAQYSSIISASREASGKMNGVVNQMDANIDAMLGANVSASGTRLGQVIRNWNSEFQQVINQLDGLTGDAENAQMISRKTATNAEQTAG